MIHTLGFIVFALVDVAITRAQPLAVLYALTLAAGCGLALDGLILVSRRWWPLSYGAACMAAGLICLPYTLERSAHFSFEGPRVRWIFFAFVAGFGIGFPISYAGARWLGRRHFGRVLLALGAVAITLFNQRMFRSGYFASHAFIAWASAIAVGAIFPRRVPRNLLAAIAAAALVAFVIPPTNQVRLELFRSPSAIAPWVAAALRWRLPHPTGIAPTPMPARAPTSPPIVDGPPLVVLMVVDGLRWSMLEDPAYALRFPSYRRLAREGVHFQNVHAPGSQTVTSMTTVFSGKYYSQLAWSNFGDGRLFGAFPVGDSSPRVPQLLSDAGVRTVKLGGIGFLGNSYGVAPGFSAEGLVPRDDHPGPDGNLVTMLLPLLASAPPQLIYAHFMDTHTPYRGPAGCTPFDCYLASAATVDSYLGRILDAIDASPQASRTLLVFIADHGEAFGEHDSGGHSTTLYEELLRVPLIVRGAGLAPRSVTEPVALIDLGPTLLDLFGQPTPAGFLGESLLTRLRGVSVPRARPLFAEGRLRRVIVDGTLKIIVDLRRKTVEEYDLARDPGELDNRFGRDDSRFEPVMARLTGFFEANTLRGGPTYRP